MHTRNAEKDLWEHTVMVYFLLHHLSSYGFFSDPLTTPLEPLLPWLPVLPLTGSFLSSSLS